MPQQMFMPKLNEAGDDAAVSEWMVVVGDTISLDTPILVMETDKVDVEVCSAVEGRVTRLFVQHGDRVKVGQPILEVETHD